MDRQRVIEQVRRDLARAQQQLRNARPGTERHERAWAAAQQAQLRLYELTQGVRHDVG